MFLPPIHCKKPYTARDRVLFYSPTIQLQPPAPIRGLSCNAHQGYHDPPRPVTQKYSPAEICDCNGATTLLAGNKYLLSYGDKALTGPYELRKKGLHPCDHWPGPVPQKPEYVRTKQPLAIHSVRIAITQTPTHNVEHETLRPKPIRLIPQYEELKTRQYKSKGAEFTEEWANEPRACHIHVENVIN